MAAWSWPLREARLTWLFVYRDVLASIAPCALFSLAVARYLHDPPGPALAALVETVALIGLYLYLFDLANQLTGVEEDRINKPDRPLPAGLVTRAGAWRRWALAMALYTALGWRLGVLPWTLLWQAVVVLHNFLGWSRHGLTKQLCMVAGTIAQLAATWQLVGPLDSAAWRWILALAIVFVGSCVHIQDLRDVAGDQAVGRRTLPLLLGERVARSQLAACMGAMPFALGALLYLPATARVPAFVCAVALAGICWMVAARLLLLRTPAADDRTYLLYMLVYCALLVSGVLLLA